MITLAQRLNKIQSPADVDEQMRLAKRYVMTLRTKRKNESTMTGKLIVNDELKQAESILNILRRKCFDIEDALAEDKPASSVLS